VAGRGFAWVERKEIEDAERTLFMLLHWSHCLIIKCF